MIPKIKSADATNTEDFQTIDCRVGLATDDHRNKAISTQVAVLALVGDEVRPGQSDDFLVSRYDCEHRCEDLSQLKAFALELGVRK